MDLHYLVDESHHLPTLYPNPNPNSNPNLGPKISTVFKREERRKRKERKRQKKLEEKLEHELQTLLALETHSLPSHPTPISNIEWPCNAIDPTPNSSESGWALPNPNPKPAPPPSALPPDPQKNVLNQCQYFLSINDDDDDEDEYVFEFFEGLFAKDENLRGYYEKNWEKGEFCCLVCGGIGEKLGKRFGDCVGLVQHANTVLKTERVGGHRAFGRALCGVLGWDVDKLPSIFYGQGLGRDCDSQEDIDGVGLHKDVGDLVGPDKGDAVDYMEADEDADTD